METLSSDAIPSAGSVSLGNLFRSGPLAQLFSAFPEVSTKPGSSFESIIIGIQIFSVLISLAIVVGIFLIIRRSRLLQEVAQTVEDVITAELSHDAISDRWDAVQVLLESDRSNDWKLAVIDADKLLEFAFRHLPFEGETLADKLKQFDSSELSVIDDVWRAHKLRNSLVHGDHSEVLQKDAQIAVTAIGSALQELGALSY